MAGEAELELDRGLTSRPLSEGRGLSFLVIHAGQTIKSAIAELGKGGVCASDSWLLRCHGTCSPALGLQLASLPIK